MSDISDIFQAGSRIGQPTRWAQADARNNMTYEAIVVSAGPVEQIEGSATAFVIGLNEYVKVEAQELDSSAHNIGQSYPLTTGDKVLVTFPYGNTSRALIVGSMSYDPRVSEYLLKEKKLPLPDTKYKGSTINARPAALPPEGAKLGGRLAITVDRLEGIREDSPTEGNQAFNQLPGSARWSTPLGDYRHNVLGEYVLYTNNEKKAVTSLLKEGATQPIDRAIHELQYALEQVRKYNSGFLRMGSFSFDPQTDGTSAVNLTTGNTAYFTSQQLAEAQVTEATMGLQRAAQETQKRLQEDECIEENVKSTSLMGSSKFKGMFGKILEQGASQALSVINKVMPSWLQLNAEVALDEAGSPKVSAISIGAMSIDPDKGIGDFQDNAYEFATQLGVEQLNNYLPSQFRVGVSRESITIGGQTVPLSKLNSEGTVTANGVTLTKDGDKVKAEAGNKKYDIAKIAQDGSLAVLGQSLTSLNQILPSQLQASYSANDDGTKTFGLGPVQLKDGDITVDEQQLGELVSGFATDKLSEFTQGAASSNWLSRMVWQEMDFTGLLDDFIKGLVKDIIPGGEKSDKSITLKDSACQGLKPGVPPRVKPSNSSPTQSGTDVNDYALNTPIG